MALTEKGDVVVDLLTEDGRRVVASLLTEDGERVIGAAIPPPSGGGWGGRRIAIKIGIGT